jgi:hypothetical protein
MNYAGSLSLSCRDHTLTELHQIQLFTTGPSEPLRTDVALKQPLTQDQAVVLARACEQRSTIVAAQATRSSKTTSWFTTKPWTPVTNSGATTTGATASTSSTHLPPTKKLMSAEITDRHRKNQCFHCDDNFTPGHKEVYKRLFIIEVVGDGDDSA